MSSLPVPFGTGAKLKTLMYVSRLRTTFHEGTAARFESQGGRRAPPKRHELKPKVKKNHLFSFDCRVESLHMDGYTNMLLLRVPRYQRKALSSS